MQRLSKILLRVTAAVATLSSLAIAKLAVAACSANTLFNPLDPNCTGNVGFMSLANDIASFMFYDIATPLCVVMVLVGAFQIMTAAGNAEKFSRGKQTLTWAAIGFAVVLVAGGITSLLKAALTNT